jgi:glycosyltransferase involved in cell wall biosynthesis
VLALSRSLGSIADVTVVASEGGWLDGAARAAGLRVQRVPEPRGNFDLRALLALRRVIREQRPDIVHSHLGRSDWYAWLSCFGSRRIKLVSTEHGISSDRQDLFVTGARRGLHEYAHGRRFKRTDAVIAVSESTARTLAERYPMLRDHPPVVIAPGLEDECLFAIERQARPDGASLRVVVVSRLAEEKGVDTAIRAFSELQEMGVAASLTVVGAGPQEQALRDLADRLVDGGGISFTGRLEDVRPALADADAFLLTSRSENLPIALLEGMASGLPVVATEVGGIPEVVCYGIDGFLVPVDDPGATARALRQLAEDQPQRLAMGMSARETARAYDMVHTVAAIGRVYESLR